MSVKTLVVDNFKGNFTEFTDGDINSGLTNIVQSAGYCSFNKPGNLTWSEDPVQIDPTGSVITDLIMAGKERVESGVVYVYAIGHTGRLYKIQVNDPTTYNPDYDNPVLIATLAINSPTFTRGGFVDFYGATDKIYIGHDKGLTSINYDGTGEAFVGVLGSWTQNVPRPLKQFVGKLYIGNGNNIAEVDSTALVTSYAKISPSFPTGTQVRDLDLSIDGNYLQIVVSSLALGDITASTDDTTIISNIGSYIMYWNGIDVGATSSISYPLVNLTSNIVFGNSQYVFGYDLRGTMFFDPTTRISAAFPGAPFGEAPSPNAVFSDGGMINFATTLYFDGHLELTNCMWGKYDDWIGVGYFAPLAMTASGTETDIIHVPYFQPVSNFAQGNSLNGYNQNIFGSSKIYFSTLETSSIPTTKYKFYKWTAMPQGLGIASSYNTYQTQTQMFSKKVKIGEVRVYGEPWVANNEFTIDLIGSGGTPITNGSKTFTAGANLTTGDDFAWYTPQCAPTYAIGLRISNSGTANNTIMKVEIDYTLGGK